MTTSSSSAQPKESSKTFGLSEILKAFGKNLATIDEKTRQEYENYPMAISAATLELTVEFVESSGVADPRIRIRPASNSGVGTGMENAWQHRVTLQLLPAHRIFQGQATTSDPSSSSSDVGAASEEIEKKRRFSRLNRKDNEKRGRNASTSSGSGLEVLSSPEAKAISNLSANTLPLLSSLPPGVILIVPAASAAAPALSVLGESVGSSKA